MFAANTGIVIQLNVHNDAPNMENLDKLNSAVLKDILAVLLEKSFEAVVITDADPHQHKILYVNSKFCQMTGYSKQELYGQSPGILSGERTNPAVIQRLKNALINGQSFIGATTNYRKDGTAYPVQWNIYPVHDAQGVPAYFISIQKDLSQLRENLARLKTSSSAFRGFLNEIKQQHAEQGLPLGNTHARQVEQSLQDNASLLAEFVKVKTSAAEDSAEVAFDTDFFDFDDTAQASDLCDDAPPQISAQELFQRYAIDEETVQQLSAFPAAMQELLNNADLHEMDVVTLGQFVRELQDLANAIFFLEEFVDVSISLSELAMSFRSQQRLTLDFLISQAAIGLVDDLRMWVDAVFVHRQAENIHWLDKSIRGSCKQILVFLNMSSS